MASEAIDIKTQDGLSDCYVAWPDRNGPFPAVLIFMDGIGVRPALRQMADRIAGNGYVVLLPNMFYRRGRAPVFDTATILKPENRPKLMELILGLTPDLVLRDAGTFIDFLATHEQAKTGKGIGVVGYCMGGSMAVRTAARHPGLVAAAASFHAGRLVSDAPDSPHRLVATIKCPLYFGHADQDQSMTAEQIETLDTALAEAGADARSELYAGAAHGFTQPDLAVFNQQASDQHWDRLLGLFAKSLAV